MARETWELLHFIDRDHEAQRGFMLCQGQNKSCEHNVLKASVEFSLPKLYKMRQILFVVLFSFVLNGLVQPSYPESVEMVWENDEFLLTGR